jgi:hypothetical protein
MADDQLTFFLADLFYVEDTLTAFNSDKVRAMRDFGVSEETIQLFEDGSRDEWEYLIGNNQGGGPTREKEANRLAKKALELAKTTVDFATSTAVLAQSLSTAQPPRRRPTKKAPAKKPRKR